MASVLLTAAGSALGAGVPGVGWLVGPLLGLAGGMVGGALDGALGLTTARVSGARLASLKVQDSRAGAPIPRLYGTMRLAGNVIWASDLMETRRTTRVGGGGFGGKGGSAQATNYFYSVHLAVGIAAGPARGLLRVWADSKLIYDAALNTTYAGALRFYNGSNTQLPDALLESYLGATNTPAFRGTAYVVLENLQLEHFGNRIPNLTFELEGISGGYSPETIAAVTHSAGSWSGGQSLRRAIPLGPDRLVHFGTRIESGSKRFVAEHYTVANGVLTLSARATSGALALTGSDVYALSPDGRYVLCANSDSVLQTELTLYAINSNTFAPIGTTTLSGGDSFGDIFAGWLDNNHLVITGYGAAGLQVYHYRRAGSTLANSSMPTAVPLGVTAGLDFYWPQTEPTRLLGTLCLFLHDGSNSTLGLARLQMQNGQVRVALLGPASLPAGSKHIIALPDNTLLVLNIASTAVARLYAVTASGLSLIRGPVTLTGFDSSTLFDAAALPAGRIAVLTSGTLYECTELTVTDTSVIISGGTSAISGSVTPTHAATLRRLHGNTLLLASTTNYLALVTPRRGDNTLAGIITDLCDAVGISTLDTSALETTRLPGFVLNDVQSAREAVQQLQDAFAFTLIESDGQLKATSFSLASSITIPPAARRASASASANAGNESAPALQFTRTQAQELPTAVQVDYLNPFDAYNSASQLAARPAPNATPTDHRLLVRLALPMALETGFAQTLADLRLVRALAEQVQVALTVSRAFSALDAGDIIVLDGLSYRLTDVREQGGLLKLSAVRQVAGTLSAPFSLYLTGLPFTLESQDAELLVLDLPPLTSSDDQPGLYLAAASSSGWRGGIVYRSTAAESPTSFARLGALAITGVATNALAAGTTHTFDNANTVTVALAHGALQSVSQSAVLNGANAALLGDEIIQFQTATLISDSTYVLSGLLRGRRGTESAVDSHAAGERFVLLDAESLQFIPAPLTARGQSITLQLVTVGASMAESLPFSITYGFRTLAPFAPVQLRATRATGSTDITFSWVRRARVNAEWLDYQDVPLDEPSELYVLEVLDGSNVVRTFSPTTTSQPYSTAQQTADFGSPPATIAFRVAQVSARYGAGAFATTTITL